jgi:hypothetical protein
MKSIRMVATCLFIVTLTTPAFAEIFKWVDEDGVAHFTDDAAQVPKKQAPTAKPKKLQARQTSMNDFWDTFQEEQEAATRFDGEETIREEYVDSNGKGIH